MNKHNVVSLEEFVKDKEAFKYEQSCLKTLDNVNDEIIKMKLFVSNSKKYIENMFKYKYVKKSFSKEIINKIDLILEQEFSK